MAEDLSVKGLTQNKTENQKDPNKRTNPDQYKKASFVDPVPKEPRLPPTRQEKLYQAATPAVNRFTTPKSSAAITDDDDIQEVHPVKSEPADSSIISSAPTPNLLSPVQASHALATAEDTLDYQEEDYGEYEQYQEGMQYQQNVQYQQQGPSLEAKGEDFFLINFQHLSVLRF